MLEKIQETADFLREKMHTSPETAIILGTGLGSLVPVSYTHLRFRYREWGAHLHETSYLPISCNHFHSA